MDVRPVTAESWDDFARLFEAKGSPHYCWCTPFRVRGNSDLTSAEKKDVTRRLVRAATPIGVLAYVDGEPVGWCSIAPRESYVRLEKSRTMPRVTPPATPTWTVLCPSSSCRSRRGQGITGALLDGAVGYARQHGARVVEAYPFDIAGVSSTHRGRFQRLRRRRLSPGPQALVPRARARAIAAIASIVAWRSVPRFRGRASQGGTQGT